MPLLYRYNGLILRSLEMSYRFMTILHPPRMRLCGSRILTIGMWMFMILSMAGRRGAGAQNIPPVCSNPTTTVTSDYSHRANPPVDSEDASQKSRNNQ
jgi:hypothetical protein